jgi:hypothetical protein
MDKEVYVIDGSDCPKAFAYIAKLKVGLRHDLDLIAYSSSLIAVCGFAIRYLRSAIRHLLSPSASDRRYSSSNLQ